MLLKKVTDCDYMYLNGKICSGYEQTGIDQI